MTCTDSLDILELIIERPRNVTQLSKALGWSFEETHNKVKELAGLGLVQCGSDRESNCQLLELHSRSHRTDRVTEQAILLGIKRWHTIPALELDRRVQAPREIIEDTLRRAVLKGQLLCSCVGMLPMFWSNQPE